jgi:predicted nicotinamide N-methyase
MTRPEPRAFIKDNLRLGPAVSVPEISIHTAHPGSGLWRLLGRDNDTPPYWAYSWAGGAALARHILDRPETVAGKRVIDLGTGSGIVAIAAAKAGAKHTIACDIDPIAIAATDLNAEANGVSIEAICLDLLQHAPPSDVDLVLAGDLFYNDELAQRALAFLRHCGKSGLDVLIGDPGRLSLPKDALDCISEHGVADFGDPEAAVRPMSKVYRLRTAVHAA